MTTLRNERALLWLLLLPVVGFLAVFFLVPLSQVLYFSVMDPGFTLKHYTAFITDGFYWKVLFGTFQTAAFVTVLALLMAYPLAYMVVRLGGAFATTILLIVTMSFWTSFLVRTFAWMVILGNNGPLRAAMEMLGIVPAPQLLFTRFSSTLAMVHLLIPFMVLALYSVMKKIDPNLTRAARSLGASPFDAFRRIFLPLSAPGIVNGCTLVFIMCLGFYVTPVLLGSPREQMIAGLIGQQIEEFLEFGEASATSVILLAVTLTVFALYNRFVGLDKLWG
ncbi:ABC transporter permease [Ferrovibrio sp.]|uniref:ABC transporter permease n=1 Tax=Ferrovibrio sp. TaxID=1917215 RepID=UPI0025C23DB4|nr:ABC transporter permease [Ferrovibrio sp.]MBX3453740.1 ABC transporter permease [Ferrovibrio sp.]